MWIMGKVKVKLKVRLLVECRMQKMSAYRVLNMEYTERLIILEPHTVADAKGMPKDRGSHIKDVNIPFS